MATLCSVTNGHNLGTNTPPLLEFSQVDFSLQNGLILICKTTDNSKI